jgi:anti-anti-sigma factor
LRQLAKRSGAVVTKPQRFRPANRNAGAEESTPVVTRAHPGDESDGEGVVVHLDGARPATGVNELRAAVVQVVLTGVPVLLVDLRRVGRLSSTTISALLWAQRRCRSQGGAVVLRGVDRRNARLLRRSGLARIFETYHRPEDGVSSR